MNLKKVIILLVCLWHVQGVEITRLVQRFRIVFAPFNSVWSNFTELKNSTGHTSIKAPMLIENGKFNSDAYEENEDASDDDVKVVYKINENESNIHGAYDNMSTIYEDNENGSFIYTLYQMNTSTGQSHDNELLRRVKRQFTSNVEAREEGMFSKMTSISYQRLQRCFEYWYENLFAKDRNKTMYTPTHPLHAGSARKVGYFARVLVNGTYRRLDMEEPK